MTVCVRVHCNVAGNLFVAGNLEFSRNSQQFVQKCFSNHISDNNSCSVKDDVVAD